MTIRKTVTLVEEINSEYGAPASPPLRRVAIAAAFENPLAGKPARADLKPLIDYSLELRASLTKTALATLGASPPQALPYEGFSIVTSCRRSASQLRLRRSVTHTLNVGLGLS